MKSIATPITIVLSIFILAGALVACDGGGKDAGEVSGAPGSAQADGVVSANLPTVGPGSFLLAANILGVMYRYDPFGGPAENYGVTEKFSEIADYGSFARFKGPVDIANNSIVAVSDANVLFVLNIENGEIITYFPLGDIQEPSNIHYPPPPVCADAICYAMGMGGDLLAIDIENEKVIWSEDLFPTMDDGVEGYPLLVTQNRIFAGGYRAPDIFDSSSRLESKLFAISRQTGDVEKELEAGAPSMAEDLLLIQNARLHAYDFDTLEPVWMTEVAALSSSAVVGDVVVMYTSSEQNSTAFNIVGINRLDGSVIWSRPGGNSQGRPPRLFHPTTDGRYIYAVFSKFCSAPALTCRDGNPLALNPADGTVVWKRQDVNVLNAAPPIVTNDHLIYEEIFLYENGESYIGVTSLSRVDGSVQWLFLPPDAFYSLTLINDGQVVRNSGFPTFISDR